MINFASILNQAIQHKKNICVIPLTRINLDILKILYNNGFIYSYTMNQKNLKIVVALNIVGDINTMKKIKIISKPSKPIYYTIKQLKNCIIKEGRFFILSTSSGIISSESALKLNTSGEVWIEVIK
ncbi:30S ribosomal protein S8 [compost metagenome]|jgi:ribosomal protein S8